MNQSTLTKEEQALLEDVRQVRQAQYEPAVKNFGAAMIGKLVVNHDKGGWEACDMQYLFRRLQEEILELQHAVHHGADPARVLGEAADVANFAMMITENHKAEHDAVSWANLLKDSDINFNLEGPTYHSAEDLQKARELAKQHGMEHMVPWACELCGKPAAPNSLCDSCHAEQCYADPESCEPL
jgi:hypothetical protein